MNKKISKKQSDDSVSDLEESVLDEFVFSKPIKNIKYISPCSMDKSNDQIQPVCEFTKRINEINTKLQELNKSTKFNELLKGNKLLETDISNLNTDVINLKIKFETSIKNINKKKFTEIIDDMTYEQYLCEIEKELNDINNDTDLEDQVEKYKIFSEKIKKCEKYLESKKATIIHM
jgi:hypothetical protein